jgi:hypothetical protein
MLHKNSSSIVVVFLKSIANPVNVSIINRFGNVGDLGMCSDLVVICGTLNQACEVWIDILEETQMVNGIKSMGKSMLGHHAFHHRLS